MNPEDMPQEGRHLNTVKVVNPTTRFDYVKYDEEAVKKQSIIKESFMAIDNLVAKVLPEGRAKSLVFTKLEEAYMWTGKAIRDEQIKRDSSSEDCPERSNG